MELFAVVMLMGLTFTVTDVASVRVIFLNTDGNQQNTFDEGDTAICRCRAAYTDAPFDSAKFEWQRHGSEDRVQITDGDQIVQEYRDRFSGANLTDIGDNTVDYRFTISNVDRYDNGYRFYCEFTYASGVSTGAGGVAKKMTVKWDPPSAQCLDIPAKVKKGDSVSYQCRADDDDVGSSGSISVWKNGNELETVPSKSGTQYNVSYTTHMTEGSVKDVYMCRYNGTGGFEEYNSNCTFNQPSCVVDDLAASCSDDSGGVSSRDHVQIITVVGLPMLIMFWVAMSG